MNFWDDLAEAIGAATGRPFALQQRQGAGGGCINEAWQITGRDGRHYFVKRNSAERADMFAAEADGLAELDRAGAIRVPRPVCHGTAGGYSYLVLERLALGGRPDPVRFGHAMAALHRHRAARFGWHRDNTIGATPQPNGWMDNWLAFWRERRLGHQVRLALRNGAPRRLAERAARLAEGLAGLFPGYRPVPSVLHGDLWSGNWGATADGTPVIFDPATYFGDREADLAMMELFGSPGADFFAAYGEAWPIDPGYPQRRTLYNLYHILNHYNLFGGGYLTQAERMLDRLLAELG